jgi:excisionase family DNA binding protein
MGAPEQADAQPDAAQVHSADIAMRRVKRYLATHADEGEIRLTVGGDPDDTLAVPRSVVELLAKVLAHMATGQAVSVVPTHAELTTQQAASLLNVSRPHLISLLDAGEIEYRKVGTHRRVRVDSLMDYKRKDDRERRDVADELTELNREMGLY